MANFFKRLGRKTAKISTRINRIATPIVAAGAGYFGGPVAGAAVTALGAQAGYYFRGTQARNEGLHGRDARARARGERKRVAIYGSIGTGAGAVGSFATSLIGGSSLGDAALAGGFGQAGKALLFGSSGTIFATGGPSGVSNLVTTGNFASQKASAVPGIVTQSQFAQQIAGGSTSAEAAAAAAGKSGESSLLAKTLGLVTTVASQTKLPGTPGGAPPTSPYGSSYLDGLLAGSQMGGGGGGGDAGGGGLSPWMNAPADDSKMSPALVAALGIGALLLLS